MTTDKVKYIFVVGIGGSDLASKAVWSAMTAHKSDVDKKIFFLESPDAREYEEVADFVKDKIASLEEVVLITISKSGKTVETLEAFHKTFDILSEKFGTSVKDRVLIVSSLNTPLWKIAKEEGFKHLLWEKNVGGRFSAFTIPHLTVLSIAGLDVNAFVDGGKEMAKRCEDGTEDNPAKCLAQNVFDYYKKEVDILDFFIFNSEFEDLGKWCRQLIAESLSLITPTVSIGPTDLHSMLELYLGGPKNRFTLFIRSLKEIEGSVNEIAYQNVIKAYEKAVLPFEKYEMPEINEKLLGGFMAYMIETTLYLAEMLQVDPYDQPAVEEYKRGLKKL